MSFNLYLLYSMDSPVLWLRIDPEMTLLREVILEQPDYQWNYQLRYERDVIAQIESLAVLDRFSTKHAKDALLEVCYFYFNLIYLTYFYLLFRSSSASTPTIESAVRRLTAFDEWPTRWAPVGQAHRHFCRSFESSLAPLPVRTLFV